MKYFEIPHAETITTNWWLDEMVQYEWQEGMPLRSGVVFCEPARLHEFWKVARDFAGRVILVSAASDFSIVEQAEQHPNQDIFKLMKAAALSGQQFPTDGYMETRPFRAPVNFKNSQATDRWAVKIDHFTMSTFNSVPPCVTKWFCSALDTDVPRSEWIPFGLAPASDPKQTRDYFDHYRQGPRSKLMYVNFGLNTAERVELRRHYEGRGWGGSGRGGPECRTLRA